MEDKGERLRINDPEWAAMIHFRLLDENESAAMDKLNPTQRERRL